MHVLKGVLACISIAIATVSVCAVLLVWWFHLAIAPKASKPAIQKRMDYIIIWWTTANRWMIQRLNLVSPEIHWEGREHLSPAQWYLVVCNHQTWADILLLQTYLLDDIPPLKFFTKSQLIWLPFVGQAMYALGFPFVKRVSREQIKKNPSLRSADKDNVMKTCEGLKNHPSAILNFAEGTRRTEEKHRLQDYAFKHLLKPKAGGINYTLDGMSSHLNGLVDVTIIYPDGAPRFWDFLQGKSGRVIFDARYRPLPEFSAEQAGETQHKAEVAQWVQRLWEEKDALISRHLASD
ncbi:MAG: acyltransferase [Proteobacteria bacterium]|jgi:1-acyl-sn-glycerol-3-phosphate acyltransferase|nr:acyltransferase [Pseudomonadota bacterium]